MIDDLAIDGDADALLSVAQTSLTGKSAGSIKEFLGRICVDAVARLSASGRVDLNEIMVVKAVGGEAIDSRLVSSVVLDKERCHPNMPLSVTSPKVLLYNNSLMVQTTEMDANIQITDPNQITAFLEQEEEFLRNLVNDIVSSGAKVVVCQKEIDDLAKHYLAKAGVLAVEKVPKSDIEALSRTTGASILNNLEDVRAGEDVLGECGLVEEKKVGELPMVFFENPAKAVPVTLILRGGTVPFVEEIERAFDDAVGVVSVAHEDGKVLTGGGSVFAALSHKLHDLAQTQHGRERMATEAFAEALLVVPRTLVENAGLDPVDEIMTLRTHHASNDNTAYGVNVFEGGLADMAEAGVFEPKRVVAQAIKSAVETAIMILRIDDVISSKKA